MRYKTFFMNDRVYGDGSERRCAQLCAIRAFLSAFVLTLIAAGFAAGMLFVDRSAHSSLQTIADAPVYEDMLRAEKLSSLWRIVGGVFPYFAVVVRLFLILCAVFGFIIRWIAG